MRKKIKAVIVTIICIACIFSVLALSTSAVTWVTPSDGAVVYKPFQEIEYIKISHNGFDYYIDFDSVFALADDYINNTIRENVTLVCIDSMNDGEVPDNVYIPVQYRVARTSNDTMNLVFYFLQSASINGVYYDSPFFDRGSDIPTTFEFHLKDGFHDSSTFNASHQIRYGFTGSFKSYNTAYRRTISASVDGMRETTFYSTDPNQSEHITKITRSFARDLRSYSDTLNLEASQDPALFDLSRIYNSLPDGSISGGSGNGFEYHNFIKGYDEFNRFVALSNVTSSITIPYSGDTNFVLFIPLTTDTDYQTRLNTAFINEVNFGDDTFDEVIVEQLPSTFLSFLDSFSNIFDIRIFGNVTLGALLIVPLATLVVLAIMRKFAGG